MEAKTACLGLTLVVAMAACQPKQPLDATATTSVATASTALPATATPSSSVVGESAALITPPAPQVTLSVQSLASPDGQWSAESSFEFLEGGAGFRVRLVVRKLDGSIEWVPVDYTQDGVGYIYPALRYWSPDSQTFHYFNMATPDGCGDFYPEEHEWVALDVRDGSLSEIPLPPGRGHTISPDGRTMIYATSAPPYGLRFRDMSSGEEGFLPLPSAPDETLKVQAGGWAWSPDGSSVALSVAYGDSCEDRETLSFAVVRIDNVQRPVLEPLVEDSAKLLRLERWVAPNHILVRDWNGESWWIDSRQGVPVAAPPP